ncbi:T9SS type A sorting domain-containing protein [bacterium]|nr:T9SS type A sorting domain-containing protein [bacterium]
MRKTLILCVLMILGLSAIAQATEVINARELLPTLRPVITLPDNPTPRSGTCVLNHFTGTPYGSFGWDPGEDIAEYFDPATDGNCTPAIYPFHITSVDLTLVIFSNTGPGTITGRVFVTCPEDAASPGVPRECKGPGGAQLGSAGMFTYDLTQEEIDDPDGTGLIELNIPLDVCVENGFFVHFVIDSWTGAGNAPAPYWQREALANCKAWVYWWFTGTPDYCWFNNNTDWSSGGLPVGAILAAVNGEAGVTSCAPLTCEPCVRNYPGDDDTNPIIIDSPIWSRTIDLCDYCSDYDQNTALGPSSFTGRGGDVVLSWTSVNDPTCFYITIAPSSTCAEWFRIRSWLFDSFGYLDAGQPAFPPLGGSQTYNWTGNGDPNDFGCWFPDTYYLYIDTRNCCCPVDVTFAGDNILAVEITSFDAIAGDGMVTLNWRTNAESEIDYYVLTRNGVEIAQVAGQGDSPSGHRYTFVDRDVVNGTNYGYQLTAVDLNGGMTLFGSTVYATPQAGAGLVTEYALMQNYPNPFNPNTTIEYALREAGQVSLKVFSVDGREVATVVNGLQDAGQHSVEFDASGLATGMYLYKLTVNGFTATQKMVLMK